MNLALILQEFLRSLNQASTDELVAEIEQARKDCADAYMFDEELKNGDEDK
jgi:hypothetical protein